MSRKARALELQADALLRAHGGGEHAIVDERTAERRERKRGAIAPESLPDQQDERPRGRRALVDVAAALFRERFGRSWKDVDVEPLRRAVGRATRRDGWRRALVEHIDKWGLRFRVWRDVELHEWTDAEGGELKLTPTGRRVRKRVALTLPRIPNDPPTIIRRRGQPAVELIGPGDHFLAALDLALISVLLGKVAGTKGQTHEATIERETATMDKCADRYGKLVRRGPVSGRRYQK